MDETFGHIPLLDAIDLDILMHKDAHFGGNFDIMIEYYENDGIGVMPDFSIDRIKELALIEKSIGTSLSESLLPLPAKQLVERSKETYIRLRQTCEKTPNSIAAKIANLILTEEEEPNQEIDDILEEKNSVFQSMVQLLQSSDYYDPLFPGYGRPPIFAAMVLERLQDPKAIPHLFSALGHENFFTDDAIIHSLISFKEKAKDFLLKKLYGEPFTKENIHAIMALTSLEDDEEIAKAALSILEKKETRKNENFLRYLIFACSGLRHDPDRKKFTELHSSFDKSLQRECSVIIKNWI